VEFEGFSIVENFTELLQPMDMPIQEDLLIEILSARVYHLKPVHSSAAAWGRKICGSSMLFQSVLETIGVQRILDFSFAGGHSLPVAQFVPGHDLARTWTADLIVVAGVALGVFVFWKITKNGPPRTITPNSTKTINAEITRDKDAFALLICRSGEGSRTVRTPVRVPKRPLNTRLHARRTCGFLLDNQVVWRGSFRIEEIDGRRKRHAREKLAEPICFPDKIMG
jgi:hypothetical protein